MWWILKAAFIVSMSAAAIASLALLVWITYERFHNSAPSRRQVILRLFAISSHKLTGHEIGQITGFWTGTLYSALIGLEQSGLIVSEWDTPERINNQPRRRLYSITDLGRIAHAQHTRPQSA